MRRDKARQESHHEAGVPIKRAIRPVLRQPSQQRPTLVRWTQCRLWAPREKQRSAYYIPPPTACSVTIINLHATPNPLLRLRIQSCHLVEVNTLLLNLVAAVNWLSLAFARWYALLNSRVECIRTRVKLERE